MSKKKTNDHDFVTLAAQAAGVIDTIEKFDDLLERYLQASGETRIGFSVSSGLGHDFFYRNRARPSVHSMVKAASYIRDRCSVFS